MNQKSQTNSNENSRAEYKTIEPNHQLKELLMQHGFSASFSKPLIDHRSTGSGVITKRTHQLVNVRLNGDFLGFWSDIRGAMVVVDVRLSVWCQIMDINYEESNVISAARVAGTEGRTKPKQFLTRTR